MTDTPWTPGRAAPPPQVPAGDVETVGCVKAYTWLSASIVALACMTRRRSCSPPSSCSSSRSSGSARAGPRRARSTSPPWRAWPALQSFVTASGEIVATRYADIGSSAMGRLVELRGEGRRPRSRPARCWPASTGCRRPVRPTRGQRAGLGALEADARGARDQAQPAQADLDAARARADRGPEGAARGREDLRAAGLIPQSDLDTAIAAADSAAAQVAAATAAVARAAQAARRRRAARGAGPRRATRARDLLDKTEITAPIDGVVTRLDVEEGEMVVIGVQNQPGTILMTVSDLSADQRRGEGGRGRRAAAGARQPRHRVARGRRRPHASPDASSRSAPAPCRRSGTQAAAREFRVKVRLDGDIAALRPGLTCDAEILVAERAQRADGAAAGGGAARRRHRRVRGPTASPRFTPVTTGIIGGLSIEVDGVAEGATVVVGTVPGAARTRRRRPRARAVTPAP